MPISGRSVLVGGGARVGEVGIITGLSRKASRASGPWYRPDLVFGGVVRANAR